LLKFIVNILGAQIFVKQQESPPQRGINGGGAPTKFPLRTSVSGKSHLLKSQRGAMSMTFQMAACGWESACAIDYMRRPLLPSQRHAPSPTQTTIFTWLFEELFVII
jgi:hypothetical protein